MKIHATRGAMKRLTKRELVLRQETVRALKLPQLIEIRGGVVVDTNNPDTGCPIVAAAFDAPNTGCPVVAIAATIPGVK
jgi:hypothetical protein